MLRHAPRKIVIQGVQRFLQLDHPEIDRCFFREFDHHSTDALAGGRPNLSHIPQPIGDGFDPARDVHFHHFGCGATPSVTDGDGWKADVGRKLHREARPTEQADHGQHQKQKRQGVATREDHRIRTSTFC